MFLYHFSRRDFLYRTWNQSCCKRQRMGTSFQTHLATSLNIYIYCRLLATHCLQFWACFKQPLAQTQSELNQCKSRTLIQTWRSWHSYFRNIPSILCPPPCTMYFVEQVAEEHWRRIWSGSSLEPSQLPSSLMPSHPKQQVDKKDGIWMTNCPDHPLSKVCSLQIIQHFPACLLFEPLGFAFSSASLNNLLIADGNKSWY